MSDVDDLVDQVNGLVNDVRDLPLDPPRFANDVRDLARGLERSGASSATWPATSATS